MEEAEAVASDTHGNENDDSGKSHLSTAISTSNVLNTVREFRNKYPSCVLLVRVGDFYELYFDQADDIGGHILGLQVVDKKFRNGTVRFTGFPSRSLLRYVEILVARHGQSVAICEQFQEPMRRSFTRKVTRVITPGTLIDDQCLSSTKVHNYILSIAYLDPHQVEMQRRLDRWRRDKAETEKRHAQDVARALADARREWEDRCKQLYEDIPKRKPGRPRKADMLTLQQQAALSSSPSDFDSSKVKLPDPPVIPPEPNMLLSQTESISLDQNHGELQKKESAMLGLAWLDLATGDFMTSIASADTLAADLARIQPSEILIDQRCSFVKNLLDTIQPSTTAIDANTGPSITSVSSDSFKSLKSSDFEPPAQPVDQIASSSAEVSQNSYWAFSAPSRQLVASPELLLLEASELSSSEQAAACALLNYILETQLGLLPPLQPPKRYKIEGHVRMSAATIQALELLRPMHADRSDAGLSLLSEIDLTKTSAGGRLLAKRLAAPSTDIDIVEQRLDLVEFFTLSSRVRDQIYEHMDNIGDIERAVNKLSLNCGGPHDLLDIARTLRQVGLIKTILREYLDTHDIDTSSISGSLERALYKKPAGLSGSGRQRNILGVVRRKEFALQALDRLVSDIEHKIRQDAERDVRSFGFLKPNCSSKINELHCCLKAKQEERDILQSRWRSKFSCSSLKLDTISNLGHFIEVSKKDSENLLASGEFRMIQSLKSKVRFENNDWSYLLSEIEMLQNLIQAEEMKVFEELRDSALAASATIRTNSKVLADLDVAISMAILSNLRQYTRPRFVSSSKDSDGYMDDHVVLNGRHPVVESQLLNGNRQYVGNDCVFNNKDSRVLLLTGPNMGGKSTYLRQIALISILAQIGSFVPADSARLHVIDAIYSRIGAHDNLALDQSTFMVEMAETADILKHATPNSLVILDEIGRGTSTTDGISIAYATLRYLHDVVRCKAVFATHYHELVPHVVPSLQCVLPLQTAIYEDGFGGFAFLHKVRPGICTKSHALYVAQIAGIPKEVLAIAREFSERHQKQLD
ncbi:MutS protein 1 [Coemansia asiatica]|uniref:MutS protein 1 n=1 Tax=Coemansia asiatica TaxID=1052880 RepID=A0A9W8CLX2_9FUNG|nr:MutS protein 1 [Coemansia asiatica]